MTGFPSAVATYHHDSYPAIDPTRPELSAKGKTIVVTGGGTGIGAEIVKHFAKAGAEKILILGRREAPLLSTRDSIQKEFPNVEIVTAPTDITKKEEVVEAFSKFIGDGKVHILVSNAGVLGLRRSIENSSTDEWFTTIESNLKGSFNIGQTFLRYALPESVLINISSAVAHSNFAPEGSSYAVAKAAGLRFFSALAYERPDLNIYNVQPGLVDTLMAKEAGVNPEDMTEEQKQRLPQFDKASLPASFVVWLASPEARYLKGKFVWANWDVEELGARREEIENGTLLDIGLVGWPFAKMAVPNQRET